MKLRTIASALALSAALLGSTALTTAPALAQDASTISGGFDVGPGGFAGNFNPLAATSGFTWLSTYLEPLVIYDAKLESVVGDLASSYEISDDQKTYTFHLADAKWHDGEPFTSKDVKFTIELAQNEKSGSVFAARLGAIDSVETPDDKTVVVTLSTPTASMTDTLTKLMMLPEHALASIPPEELAKNAWWSTQPIGTGPFKFTKYVTDQYVELAANPDYRGGQPAVERLINRYFENPAAAIAALRAGEIEFTYVDSNDVSTFKDDSAFRVIEGDSYVVNYIGFNQEVPLFKDLRVRQAFMYAINRDAIIQSLYGGAAKPANCVYVAEQLVPEGIETYAYDPAKAKALLDEAGWAELNGDKPITILTYYNSPLVNNVLAAMQAMLAQVGINIVPRAVDTPTYNATVYKQGGGNADEFPLVFAGLQDGPDPSNINIGLNEKQIPPAGNNFLHIKMPEVTSALDAALAEVDPAQRNARYQDVCKATNAELPWGTMWVASRYGVASSKLQDFVWTPAPAGGPYEAHPEKWSLAE
jgi:peptide/nickel transport system substrate-binding protein